MVFHNLLFDTYNIKPRLLYYCLTKHSIHFRILNCAKTQLLGSGKENKDKGKGKKGKEKATAVASTDSDTPIDDTGPIGPVLSKVTVNAVQIQSMKSKFSALRISIQKRLVKDPEFLASSFNLDYTKAVNDVTDILKKGAGIDTDAVEVVSPITSSDDVTENEDLIGATVGSVESSVEVKSDADVLVCSVDVVRKWEQLLSVEIGIDCQDAFICGWLRNALCA